MTIDIQISDRQRKAVEKIARLRKYFGKERPEIYEWTTADESIDFAGMTDEQVASYLEANRD
ncbi:hypothetical protein [Terriglobus sp. RCC_193]|uniref:hypothetical protein n=1 Tax=Terriglobus sp. RCC_193 TaxID=3239218 RepID=UPI0035263892